MNRRFFSSTRALMRPYFKNMTFNFIPVKVNLSLNKTEARHRVLNLYKLWYRQIPVIFYDYNLPIDPQEGRSKLREIFVKNSNITDVRVINGLVARGQMELNETVNKQKEGCHIWKYFTEDTKKSQSFISKFLDRQ